MVSLDEDLMILESDRMDCTERWLAIINRIEIPDRIPIHLMGFPEYSQTMIEFIEKEDEIMENDPFFQEEENILITPLGDKTLSYYFGAEDTSFSVGIKKELRFVLDKNGNLTKDSSESFKLDGLDTGKYVNYMGRLSGWHKLNTGHRYTWYIDGWLKSREKITSWFDEHGWPHEQEMREVNAGAIHDFKTKFSDRMYLGAGLAGSGIFEDSWFMQGFNSWALNCVKDPDLIRKIISSLKEARMRAISEMKRFKPELVWCADDMGQKGRPLLSPKWFKKFYYETFKELFGAIHDLGAKVFMHSCGNIVELLPLLIECGLDGWQSMEVASEIDHGLVKKKFGDQLILIGGIDSSREMTFGTPRSIEEHVKSQIKKMGKDGGYIAGPAHDYLKVPLENALAMRDAIYKHGIYN